MSCCIGCSLIDYLYIVKIQLRLTAVAVKRNLYSVKIEPYKAPMAKDAATVRPGSGPLREAPARASGNRNIRRRRPAGGTGSLSSRRAARCAAGGGRAGARTRRAGRADAARGGARGRRIARRAHPSFRRPHRPRQRARRDRLPAIQRRDGGRPARQPRRRPRRGWRAPRPMSLMRRRIPACTG